MDGLRGPKQVDELEQKARTGRRREVAPFSFGVAGRPGFSEKFSGAGRAIGSGALGREVWRVRSTPWLVRARMDERVGVSSILTPPPRGSLRVSSRLFTRSWIAGFLESWTIVTPAQHSLL